MIYGYARVKPAGVDDRDAQESALFAAGCNYVVTEGRRTPPEFRPKLRQLLARLESGSTLMIVSADCVAHDRSDLSKLVARVARAGAKFLLIGGDEVTTMDGGGDSA